MDRHTAFGIILPVLFGAVLLFVAVTLVPMLLFYKTMDRVRALEKRGDKETAYQLAQKLLQTTRLPVARKAVGEGFIPLLLLHLGRLAESLGDTDAAVNWTKQVSDSKFDSSYRVMALQHQAMWLRKQNRNEEAHALEDEALNLPVHSNSTKKITASEATSTDTARSMILFSQGHFQEALEHIKDAWRVADDNRRMGLAGHKAMILRTLGRYDEALAAQQDMEIRFEKMITPLANPHSATRQINGMLRKQHQILTMISRLTRIQICLEAGKVGAAGETWGTLPAEVIDDNTEALRYATGAWLFAVRGNTDSARRLITDLPAGSDLEQRTAINALLGRALFALHDYNTAAEQFQAVLTACAGKPLAEAENRALLAACYAKQEKFDLARAEWKAVVAAGFEEAFFTQEARTQLARLQTNDTSETEPMRLSVGNR